MSVYLSTKDNPYNPDNQFNEWLQFDIDHHYDCCGLLDSIAKTSDSFTDQENDKIISDAIDFIIKNDPEQIYCKIQVDS